MDWKEKKISEKHEKYYRNIMFHIRSKRIGKLSTRDIYLFSFVKKWLKDKVGIASLIACGLFFVLLNLTLARPRAKQLISRCPYPVTYPEDLRIRQPLCISYFHRRFHRMRVKIENRGFQNANLNSEVIGQRERNGWDISSLNSYQYFRIPSKPISASWLDQFFFFFFVTWLLNGPDKNISLYVHGLTFSFLRHVSRVTERKNAIRTRL